MRNAHLIFGRAGCIVAALATCLWSGSASAQYVGRIGAANPAARGSLPRQSARILQIGAPVLHNETIATSTSGTVQVSFIDKSIYDIGRNTTVVINEFIFDPGRVAGRFVATVSQGVVRIVGGQISHVEGETIRTRAATISLGGGVATIAYRAGQRCELLVIDEYGRVDVTNHTGTVTILRPGYGVCVASVDTPIEPPRPVDADTLEALVVASTSAPGEHGGARRLPRAAGLTGQAPNNPNPTGDYASDNVLGIVAAGNGLARKHAHHLQSLPLQSTTIVQPPPPTQPPPILPPPTQPPPPTGPPGGIGG